MLLTRVKSRKIVQQNLLEKHSNYRRIRYNIRYFVYGLVRNEKNPLHIFPDFIGFPFIGR